MTTLIIAYPWNESEVVDYLLDHPDFFVKHANVWRIRYSHAHKQAYSLVWNFKANNYVKKLDYSNYKIESTILYYARQNEPNLSGLRWFKFAFIATQSMDEMQLWYREVMQERFAARVGSWSNLLLVPMRSRNSTRLLWKNALGRDRVLLTFIEPNMKENYCFPQQEANSVALLITWAN